LPVINTSKELVGVVTAAELLKAVGNFSGAAANGGIVVLEMSPVQFSISEISRIIENNDCTLLHLNTQTNAANGLLTVFLQVNKKEIASLIATFERYEYDVVLYYGNEKFENEIKSNYEHLMNYLDI
jgi:CBS-domain-containing membrane protein